ncbi:MAG: trypco2 family protein [Methylococcus sp.]
MLFLLGKRKEIEIIAIFAIHCQGVAMSQDTRIRLSDLIDNLRKELIVAQRKGEGADLKFGVEEVELEVEVTSTKKGAAEAGVEFWVVTSKVEGEISNEIVHTIKLKLKPTTNNTSSTDPSNPSLLEVNKEELKPRD